MKRVAAMIVLLVLGFAWSAKPAHAEQDAPATFALIIGSNKSVDVELPPLKYADDDAADYFDLFRLLGARTYLLSRLDEDTQRLHPQAAAEALEPRRTALDQAVTALVADVARARARHVETVVYVVYAGHGNVHDSEGYVTLEDARLTGADFAVLVAKLPATNVHVIVDACASYYLVYSRGPGGERRPLSGFQKAISLANDARVGLLLSTSSGRESHEWEGFQAGVFSHEVRSGLYGAADADGDGRVSYREIAAFVARANQSIPNERYRPDVLARPPPQGSDTLMDLQGKMARRIDIDGAHAGHYWIEDSQGVRLLDAHNGRDQTIHLVRPTGSGLLYVRRAEDDAEFELPATREVVAIGDLQPGPRRTAPRGAAQVAYQGTFSLPFDLQVVKAYRSPESWEPPAPAASRGDAGVRRALAWSVGALGLAGIGVGVSLSVHARSIGASSSASDSQATVDQHNTSIHTSNMGAAIGYVGGCMAILTSAALLLWPEAPRLQTGLAASGGVYIGYEDTF